MRAHAGSGWASGGVPFEEEETASDMCTSEKSEVVPNEERATLMPADDETIEPSTASSASADDDVPNGSSEWTPSFASHRLLAVGAPSSCSAIAAAVTGLGMASLRAAAARSASGSGGLGAVAAPPPSAALPPPSAAPPSNGKLAKSPNPASNPSGGALAAEGAAPTPTNASTALIRVGSKEPTPKPSSSAPLKLPKPSGLGMSAERCGVAAEPPERSLEVAKAAVSLDIESVQDGWVEATGEEAAGEEGAESELKELEPIKAHAKSDEFPATPNADEAVE